ncbi:MAG: histidine kinase [Melioribacteraceae bacterium]|nr:histidine kinase [Melioribacteraceae bacterium]
MKITKRISTYIIISAVVIQLIIISYNNLTGFINIQSLKEFAVRLLMGSFFASIASFYLFYFNFMMIDFLERKYNWKEKFLKRIAIELAGVILIALSGGIFITLIVNAINKYNIPLYWILFTNGTIAIIVNFIIVSVIEGVNSFVRSQKALVTAEKLEKENVEIRLETLKNQLNPHFLFNSLNVLTSLIENDSKKATDFVDEFSSIYRYTLEVIDKKVMPLREEIEFAKSYLYLQSIRFEDAVKVEMNIENDKLDYFVPPLAVQTLLENAFKHNKAAIETPLIIKILSEENHLIVINNYQPKSKSDSSHGVGLENLRKRYEYICGEIPLFNLTDNYFKAVIPLIKPE